MLTSFCVTPDGRRFVLAHAADSLFFDTPQIVVATNWLDEVKQRLASAK